MTRLLSLLIPSDRPPGRIPLEQSHRHRKQHPEVPNLLRAEQQSRYVMRFVRDSPEGCGTSHSLCFSTCTCSERAYRPDGGFLLRTRNTSISASSSACASGSASSGHNRAGERISVGYGSLLRPGEVPDLPRAES